MEKDEIDVNEEKDKTENSPVEKTDNNEKSIVPLDLCSESPDESNVHNSQADVSFKTIRPTENDGVLYITDELPVKRVRFDKDVEDESSYEVNVKKSPEKSPISNISKSIHPGVVKSLYKIKWVEWEGSYVPIITQNENGPCPLIAIVNILLLRRKLSLKEGTLDISAEELVEHVRKALERTVPKDCEVPNPNHLQNMLDAVALLPQLQTGLNVNVKFNGVKNFEYTPGCIIFDLLDIPLYHGWLLDPQSAEVVSAVSTLSYNQLVEMIVIKKTSKDLMERNQAEVAEQFLETTATQLTCHGLCELNAALRNGEMAVLFRNNHFSVIYKHKEALYQLVTDQGFLDEKRVVWETLSSIFGDETFLDGSFRSLLPKASGPSYSPLPVDKEHQISQDFFMALSLEDEQNKQQDKEFGWNAFENAHGAIGMINNEELAKKLFIKDKRMAQVSVSSGRARLNTDVPENTGRPANVVVPEPGLTKESEESSKSKEWKCTVS